MSSEVILLKDIKELTQYARVSAFSFFDTTGWCEELITSESLNAQVFGCREQGQIMSGVISHNYSFSYWGERGISSSGIGAVASDPAVRNKGHIRDIMTHILKENYKDGKILSFLFPFSYKYYGMFGYGTMGHCSEYRFSPEDISRTPVPPGEYTLYDGSEEQYSRYVDLIESWSYQFHGGVSIKNPLRPREDFNKAIKEDRQFIYFYRDSQGKPLSCLQFKMERGERAQKIRIIKSAWQNGASFRALVHFLWRHRNQVGEIIWDLPLSIPLEMLMKEPRIHRNDIQKWMGRPVHVLKALQIKSRYTPVKKPFAFTLEDPAIPENNGSYRLDGEDVVQEKTDLALPVLDFPTFSAMIMGGLSLEEAKLAGLVQEDFEGDSSYLSRLSNINITVGF
jgi:predicted acetyltransferase